MSNTAEDPERIESGASLAESSLWARALLDHCPSNIFLKDAEGRYLFVNRQFERAFGISREQLVGKRSQEVFSLEQAAVFQQQDEQVLRAAEPAEFEGVAMFADGPHTAIIQKFPLFDSQGRLCGLGGIATDITDRKSAEHALRESELWCRQLVDAIPLALYACDRGGHIRQFNRAAEALWGGAPEPNALAREFFKTIRVHNSAGAVLNFDEMPMGIALRTGRAPNPMEVTVERADGAQFTLVSNVSAIQSAAGELVGWVNCLVDISERKHSEATLASLSERLINAQEEERKRIARDLHDHLAQRLSLLMIGLDNLSQSVQAASPERAELNDLLALADEIASDLHEISHSLHSTKLEHLGLRAALGDLCLRTAKQHHIPVRLESDDFPGLPPDIALCLFRVTQEALNNAVKYSRAPEIFVTLRQTATSVSLRVEDSGVGFGPEAANSGLGLASMRERLRMAHGEFYVQSAPGQGTRIIAEIPWIPRTAVRRPRVVLADDHRAMLDEVSRLLDPDAEIVASVSDGAAAVQAVTECEPDAVVLDIAMPGTGGIEAARQLRAAGYSTRIIFLTVQSDPEYARIAESLKASYVLKARMRSDLPLALREALAGRVFHSPAEEWKSRGAHP